MIRQVVRWATRPFVKWLVDRVIEDQNDRLNDAAREMLSLHGNGRDPRESGHVFKKPKGFDPGRESSRGVKHKGW